MSIVAIESIIFIILHLISMICGITRFNKLRIFSLLEIGIPVLGVVLSSLLLVSQFIDTTWLLAVSYSLNFLIQASVMPFVFIRLKSRVDNVSTWSTITMIVSSVIGIILTIIVGTML